ncbi:MAG: hypothetical protein JW774_11525 [Candidatus Aureabacteria bacterium]|nr:hypothetical protein [Candidatus Auribacterota bacterium]
MIHNNMSYAENIFCLSPSTMVNDETIIDDAVLNEWQDSPLRSEGMYYRLGPDRQAWSVATAIYAFRWFDQMRHNKLKGLEMTETPNNTAA